MTDKYDAGICLLEDDPIMGESLNQFFELEDLPCDWFRTLGEARPALRRRHYCALIGDVRLLDGNGGFVPGDGWQRRCPAADPVHYRVRHRGSGGGIAQAGGAGLHHQTLRTG